MIGDICRRRRRFNRWVFPRKARPFFDVLLRNLDTEKGREDTLERKAILDEKAIRRRREKNTHPPVSLFLPLLLPHHGLFQYYIAVVVEI
jgi:hypothetical protein